MFHGFTEGLYHLWRTPLRRTDSLAAGLLLLLALLFQAPGLLPGRVAAPMDQVLTFAPWHAYHPESTPRQLGGDLLLQQLPWRHWMQQELATGRFPLWAAAPAGGMPLFANMQAGVLYPLHLLWILLPLGVGLGLIMALKLWLAGLGMWGFLRALGLHPAAVLLAALSFEFSASMVNWLSWNLSGVYLLLPWFAWATYAWCVTACRPALAGLAVLTACSIFGGHPETMFIVGVVTALWAGGLILSSAPRQWGRQIAGLTGAAALGLALGAIQLLPFLQVLPLTGKQRANQPETTALLHLDPVQLLDWALPHSWGYTPDSVLALNLIGFTEANGYIGLVGLLGVGLACLAALRRRLAFRLALPWIVITVVAGLVAYDDHIGYAIRLLPGFNQSINVRWVIVPAASLSILSAFGWDWLARHAGARLTRTGTGRLTGAGLVLFIEGLLLTGSHLAGLLPLPSPMEKMGPWLAENDSYRVYWAVWAGSILLMVLGLVALWQGSRRLHRLAPTLLCGVVILDLWRLLLPINGTAPTDQYFPSTPFLRQLQDQIPSPERFLIQGNALPSNTALVYGLRDWRVQDPMLTYRAQQAAFAVSPGLTTNTWNQYNMFMQDINFPVATMLGIRYFVLPVPAEAGDFGDPADNPPPISRLAYKDGLSLWRADGVPGFAYLSDKVQVLPNPAAVLAALQQVTWRDARAYKALVEGPPENVAAIHAGSAVGPPGQVTVQEYLPGHIRLTIAAERPSLLVISESWYPGWRALLNGQDVPILRANYLSQGVVVPAGAGTLVLDYVPDAFRYGALLSGVATLGLALLALWAWRVRLPRRLPVQQRPDQPKDAVGVDGEQTQRDGG